MASSDPIFIESLFCKQTYENSNTVWLVISHVVTILIMLFLLCLILSYARRRRQSPIRERSPLLSIIQLAGFYGLLLQTYVTEIYLAVDEAPWEDVDGPWRCFNKAFYISLRVVAYTIFVLR